MGLLNSLRLQECETALADGADDGVVGEWGGLEGDVDDEREVGKAVQVRNCSDQDRRASDNGDRLAVAQRVESRQEGVLIVANGLDLAECISNCCLTEEAMGIGIENYQRSASGQSARSLASLQGLEGLGEQRVRLKGRLDGQNEIARQVGDPRDC